MANKFYITTAIPYVNAKPHLGFALELIQADVVARYHRIKGDDVFFLTGTDENAFKNLLSAREQGVDVHDLINKNAQSFKDLKKVLNLSWDDFIRTTEDRHVKGTQKFWQACEKDIYKKKYSGIYCNGCEEFKREKDLVIGHCPEHPDKALEHVDEENYFFRLSSYQQQIEKLIESGTIKIIPEARRNEVLAFVKQGLEDFSISRTRSRAPDVGIPVPGDDKQTIYVWFDALINYITGLGYADDSENFKKYWQEDDNILHVIGKGVSRFHAVYWPAMLLSAGLNLPKQIFVHGYITVEGKKISKSLGNIINPSELISKYGNFGRELVRYYLLRETPAYEDGDFSVAKLEERYSSDLANGLGNLVARTVTLGEKISPVKFDFALDIDAEVKKACNDFYKEYELALSEIKLHEALINVWGLISFADKYINEKKPWEVKDEEQFKKIMANSGYLLGVILNLVEPFLPETGEKIRKQIWFSESAINFKKGDNLFPRLN